MYHTLTCMQIKDQIGLKEKPQQYGSIILKRDKGNIFGGYSAYNAKALNLDIPSESQFIPIAGY